MTDWTDVLRADDSSFANRKLSVQDHSTRSYRIARSVQFIVLRLPTDLADCRTSTTHVEISTDSRRFVRRPHLPTITDEHSAEFTSLVKSVISRVIGSVDLSQQKQFFHDRMIPILSAATNLHWFGISGSLLHLSFDSERWTAIVGESFGVEEAKSILECIEKIYEVSRSLDRIDRC